MFVQRIKIPVCTDLNKNLFKTDEILFYNFVVHAPWNKLKTQWNLHFPSNNGKTLVCAKCDRAINCEFNLTLMFSGLLKKDLFDGKFFQTKFVTQGLPSSFLFHPVAHYQHIESHLSKKQPQVKILIAFLFSQPHFIDAQGRNKVYGIRDQRQKNGVGSGITAPGTGITSHGIRISGTVKGSGIRFSDITTKTAQFWNES